MEFGITLFIFLIAIIAIWVVIEIKRMKHKLFAIFLIFLLVFIYVSTSYVFKDKNIDFTNPKGFIEGANVYFSWLGSAFSNIKVIASNAVKMDWNENRTNS